MKISEDAKNMLIILAVGAVCVGVVSIAHHKDHFRDTSAEVSDDTLSIVATTNCVEFEKKALDTKIFEPGEHVFMIRYDFYGGTSSSISVPAGYEVLDIENYINTTWDVDYTKVRTRGYDVWFINNETVEVSSVYNEASDTYDYSQPGKVIVPMVTNENVLGK